MSPLHLSTCMVQCRHIQTTWCSTSWQLPVHLPSSVWGFLSAVDFKLLARTLDLVVAAYLLCIDPPLFLVEYTQQALFLPHLRLGLEGITSPFMLCSVAWYTFIPVSFSEVSVPSPPLPWILGTVHHRPCLQWLMTFLKRPVSWFAEHTYVFVCGGFCCFCVVGLFGLVWTTPVQVLLSNFYFSIFPHLAWITERGNSAFTV